MLYLRRFGVRHAKRLAEALLHVDGRAPCHEHKRAHSKTVGPRGIEPPQPCM
jgi:hypothetical protein